MIEGHLDRNLFELVLHDLYFVVRSLQVACEICGYEPDRIVDDLAKCVECLVLEDHVTVFDEQASGRVFRDKSSIVSRQIVSVGVHHSLGLHAYRPR